MPCRGQFEGRRSRARARGGLALRPRGDLGEGHRPSSRLTMASKSASASRPLGICSTPIHTTPSSTRGTSPPTFEAVEDCAKAHAMCRRLLSSSRTSSRWPSGSGGSGSTWFCADVCTATCRVISRQTEHDASAAPPLLEACISACRSWRTSRAACVRGVGYCRVRAEGAVSASGPPRPSLGAMRWRCRHCAPRPAQVITRVPAPGSDSRARSGPGPRLRDSAPRSSVPRPARRHRARR